MVSGGYIYLLRYALYSLLNITAPSHLSYYQFEYINSLAVLQLSCSRLVELATMVPTRDFTSKEVCSLAHPVALCLHMLTYDRKLWDITRLRCNQARRFDGRCMMSPTRYSYARWCIWCLEPIASYPYADQSSRCSGCSRGFSCGEIGRRKRQCACRALWRP